MAIDHDPATPDHGRLWSRLYLLYLYVIVTASLHCPEA